MLDALICIREQVRVRVRRAADVSDALRFLSLQLALQPTGMLVAYPASDRCIWCKQQQRH